MSNPVYPSRSHVFFLGSPTHYAMHLHNELQRQGRVGGLVWDDRMTGPEHQGLWTSIVYISGVQYGTGTAATRQGARDAAAKHTFEIFQDEAAAN
ncbi:hypothetical protein BU17DRAFT_96368 [Hysterangium stoloniferum]|nr:hypothetical protein BU17DRAFT_96368 [Hysterangium stoloniferum]